MYPLGLSIFDDPGDTMGISTWVHSQVIHWGSNWTKKLRRLCVVFSHHIYNKTSGWWFGTFSIFPYIFPYIGKNDPNWLIFFRGVETTNQTWILILVQYNRLYPKKNKTKHTKKLHHSATKNWKRPKSASKSADFPWWKSPRPRHSTPAAWRRASAARPPSPRASWLAQMWWPRSSARLGLRGRFLGGPWNGEIYGLYTFNEV